MNDEHHFPIFNSEWGLFPHGLIKEPDFQPIPFPRYVRLAYGSRIVREGAGDLGPSITTTTLTEVA